MGETRSKAQLPMEAIRTQPPPSEDEAFLQGLQIGREWATAAVERATAWARENPGQLLIAGVAAGFVLGKILLRPRRMRLTDLG